jgi:hypothetical protein
MDSEHDDREMNSDSDTPAYRSPRLASLGRTVDHIRGNNPSGARDAAGGFYGS